MEKENNKSDNSQKNQEKIIIKQDQNFQFDQNQNQKVIDLKLSYDSLKSNWKQDTNQNNSTQEYCSIKHESVETQTIEYIQNSAQQVIDINETTKQNKQENMKSYLILTRLIKDQNSDKKITKKFKFLKYLEENTKYIEIDDYFLISLDGQIPDVFCIVLVEFTHTYNFLLNIDKTIHFFKENKYYLGKYIAEGGFGIIVFQEYEKFQSFNQGEKNMIENFKKIVYNFVLKEECSQRKTCLELHKLFYGVVIFEQNQEFSLSYIDKVRLILSQSSHDCNKDIQFFNEVSIYYNEIILDLKQKIKKSHIQRFLEIESIEISLEKVDQISIKKDPECIIIYNSIASFYNEQSQFKRAKEQLLKSLELQENNEKKVAQEICILTLIDKFSEFVSIYINLHTRNDTYYKIRYRLNLSRNQRNSQNQSPEEYLM
ncbi:hypothetical protein ABPG72_017530 [Tetrahymena utriculariae]